MNSNIFRFDKFLEPVVIVSRTRKNYFNWALSDWAIKANVCPLTFGPPCLKTRPYLQKSNQIAPININSFFMNSNLSSNWYFEIRYLIQQNDPVKCISDLTSWREEQTLRASCTINVEASIKRWSNVMHGFNIILIIFLNLDLLTC